MSELAVPLALAEGRAATFVPATGERIVVERPPPGLGRGAHSASSAVVIALAVALLVVFVTYYVLRFRKRAK